MARVACLCALVAVLCGLTGCMLQPPDVPIHLPSDVYVDAASGNDTTGDGTAASPYRTISGAVTALYDAAGWTEDDWWSPASWAPVTLHVAPGLYNVNHGETGSLLNGMNLVGEGASRDDVVIAVGIGVLGDSTIRGITVSDIVLSQKDRTLFDGRSVVLDDVVVGSVWAEDCASEIKIRNSRFGGISLHLMTAAVEIEDCESTGQGGIRVDSDGSVVVRSVMIIGGKVGLQAFSSVSVVLAGNEIRDSDSGIYVDGGTVLLESNTVSGCQLIGLEFSSETAITLADNEITGNMVGISIDGDTSGEVVTSGTNVVKGNDVNIDDRRASYSEEFFIRGITWDDPQPSGAIHGPTGWIPGFRVHIENVGNTLVF